MSSRTQGSRRRNADGTPVTLTYFEFGTLAALWLFARARPRRADSRSRIGRPPRRRQHRRPGCGHIDQRGHRPRRLSRSDARGHRPRKGRDLSRRPSCAVRGSRSARERRGDGERDRRRSASHRTRLRLCQRRLAVALPRPCQRWSRRALRPAVSRIARRLSTGQRGHRARGTRHVCIRGCR